MSPDLLFVYGTLRRRFAQHSRLQRLGAFYVGKGSICGELFDLGNFPGAVKPDNTARLKSPWREDARKVTGTASAIPLTPSNHGQPARTIVGEVFRLPNPEGAFRTLDAYEGACTAAGLYRREQTEVTLENSGRTVAWVYWLNHTPSGLRRIISGDYARKRKP